MCVVHEHTGSVHLEGYCVNRPPSSTRQASHNNDWVVSRIPTYVKVGFRTVCGVEPLRKSASICISPSHICGLGLTFFSDSQHKWKNPSNWAEGSQKCTSWKLHYVILVFLLKIVISRRVATAINMKNKSDVDMKGSFLMKFHCIALKCKNPVTKTAEWTKTRARSHTENVCHSFGSWKS